MTTMSTGADVAFRPTRERVRDTLVGATSCTNAEASRMIVVFKKAADSGAAYQLRQLERTMLSELLTKAAEAPDAIQILAEAYLANGQIFAYNPQLFTITVVPGPVRQ